VFLAESYALDQLPSLGSRMRLSSEGVSGEFVYAGFTESGDIVAVPLVPLVRMSSCQPVACPGAKVHYVEDEGSHFDARRLLSLLEATEYESIWPNRDGSGGFLLGRLAVKPRTGDLLEIAGKPMVFCGNYRSKWVLATQGAHTFQPLGTVTAEGTSWNIAVLPERDHGLLCGLIESDTASRIFRKTTDRPFPGSRVRMRGVDGMYLRWDGRFGLHHQVAFPIEESARSTIATFDVDRIVEVDDTSYAVCWVSINQNMNLFELPDPVQTRLALQIADTPSSYRRHL